MKRTNPHWTKLTLIAPLAFSVAATLSFGCGDSSTDMNACEGVDVTTAADAVEALQALDVDPTPAAVTNAIEAGCAASTSDTDVFVSAVLCDLGIDPDLASDANVQEAVDNLGGVDTSDIPARCEDA